MERNKNAQHPNEPIPEAAMSEYSVLLKEPNSLYPLLEVARVEDLSVLTDYITDSGEGRVSLDSDVCSKLVAAAKRGSFTSPERVLIGKEVLLYGGNSVANAFRSLWSAASNSNRDATITYRELVHDVAKQIGAGVHTEADVQSVERAILLTLFRKSLDTLSKTDREAALKAVGATERAIAAAGPALAAVSAAAIGAMVAGGLAQQALGRTLVFAAPALVPSISAFAGPVGIMLGGLWSAAGLASPAYRITIPCVVQLAHMRTTYMDAANSKACSACGAHVPTTAKFCTTCGAKL
ncbi:hypothetical protein GmRootV77_42360 [Variovorax sp. V77]|uniref:zinc-ribbon domain-containing protein n=2 Tax=Variovorax TaxID=34072 RepID=UPI0034E8AEDE